MGRRLKFINGRLFWVYTTTKNGIPKIGITNKVTKLIGFRKKSEANDFLNKSFNNRVGDKNQ